MEEVRDMSERQGKNKLYIVVAAAVTVVILTLIAVLLLYGAEKTQFATDIGQDTVVSEILLLPEMQSAVTTVPLPGVSSSDYPVSTEFPRSSPIPMPAVSGDGTEETSGPGFTTLPLPPGHSVPIPMPTPSPENMFESMKLGR